MRECFHCGGSLANHRSDAVWCSDACRKAAKRAAGADETRLKAKRPEARYCSDTCRCRAWNRDHPRIPTESRTTAENGNGKQPTDCERMLRLLEEAGERGVHTHELRKQGITGDPCARRLDLERQGFVFRVEREHVGRRPGARYWLEAAA